MDLKRKNKIKKSSIGLFGLFIIVIGIGLLSYDFILSKKELAFTLMNIKLFESEMPEQISKEVPEEIKNDDVSPEEITNTETQSNYSYNYIGVIEIPKINLKKGFLDIDSRYNNISYNVTVIQTSTYPDVENGNLILAAHSGESYISYFKNLYKLTYGDQAYIYYNNIKYTYEIVDIYNVEKTGQVEIRRNNKKTVLTLITCTHNSDTEQTVYILELVNKEEY